MEMPEFSFRHLGINSASAEDAQDIIDAFKDVFGQKEISLPRSSLVSGQMEIMKEPAPGEKGHIGFTVRSIPEALEYLESKGWTAVPEGIVRYPNGNIKIVYLNRQVGGFAIHLFCDENE